MYVDPAAQKVTGATATVGISVENALDLGAYAIVVTWDDSILTLIGINNGTFLGSTGRTVTCPAPVIGVNSVAFGCTTTGAQPGPAGSGGLAAVEFGTLSLGTSPAALSGVTITDTSGAPLGLTTNDGTVTVQQPTATPIATPTPTGTATPTSTPTPTVPLTPTPTSVTLPSVADTFMREANPDVNFGTDIDMQVNGQSTGRERSLVLFDVSSIPAGSTVSIATLTLCYRNAPGPAAGRTHELRRATTNWTELGVTWNTQPSVLGTASTWFTVPSTTTCEPLTVTADVQDWVNGSSNFGLRLSDQDETVNLGSNTKYAAREYGTAASRPRLDVTYAPP